MVDTLDLVVVGKNSDNYYMLACYDDKNDKYIAICILDGSKFTQQIKLYAKHDDRIVCMYEVQELYYPEVVVEISCKSIGSCISPRSPFFIIQPELIKIREDKNAEHATTLSEVATLYKLQ